MPAKSGDNKEWLMSFSERPFGDKGQAIETRGSLNFTPPSESGL